jgi:hypothetical protein
VTFTLIPEHYLAAGERCEYLDTDRGCHWCCGSCNYNRHQCPGCGDELTHRDTEYGTGKVHEGCCE